MQERPETRGARLQHAAQYFALGLHLHPQIHEFALQLLAPGDIGHPHRPDARLVRGFHGAEFKRVVRALVAAVRVGQAYFHILQRIRRRARAPRKIEQIRHMGSRRAQGFRGNEGCDEFFEA